MKRQLIILLLKWGWILMLISLTGCGDKAPTSSQPKSTSKKITVQSATTPKATDGENQTSSSEVKPGATGAAISQAQQAASENSPAPQTAETSELIKASLQIAGSYNPEGRFDPFEPLFKEAPTVQEEASQKGKRERRKPQTPLERVALSQLKVTAIIRSPSGNRALVEDATGKGYVVKKGTYIGLNAGQVIDIDKDRIVVEEEIESVMGELRIENSELKLQKPAGEF